MEDRDIIVLDQLDKIINEGQLINDNVKKYGNPKDYLEMAKIVFDFVKKKGLIIYGGEAIDKNLKNIKEPGVYTKDTKPDYDFYSPDYERDSIELCNILFDKGYHYVTRFPRMHRGTFGIRANTADIADISYVPENIFNKIPKVKIDGVYYISSSFVLKNLYQGLVRPRLSANYARWEKDYCRLQLFDKHFPPQLKSAGKRKGGKKESTEILTHLEKEFVHLNPLIVITGTRAFQYYVDQPQTGMFELLSVNGLIEQHVAMIEKILSPLGKIEKEVYTPFLNDLPARVRIKVDNEPVADIYDVNHECVAATGNYVNYYFLMHWLYARDFYNTIYPNYGLGSSMSQIIELKKTRETFLTVKKLTGFEQASGKFQVFTSECIGIQKSDPEITREQIIAGVQQYPRYYPEFEYIDLKKYKPTLVPPDYNGLLIK